MTDYVTGTKLTASSEEDDYYMLQPMFEKLPPNEIISDKYAPDIIPYVKLVTKKDEKLNNAHFVPPKAKSQQLQIYANCFNMFDYVGNKYAKQIHQVVYLKFNNSQYNLVPGAKHKTRVMSAFYVPFQLIYNTQQSYFTKNIGLDFPQISSNCYFPQARYNRGCSFDPIFSSNYESANLFAAIRKNPFQYDLILQNDVNSCQSIGWFNFTVQFSQEGYYSFRIVNLTTDMSKLFERGMKISFCPLNTPPNKQVKKNGEGWGFCGQNIKFSKSNVDIELKSGQKYYELYFQYKCKNKHEIIMFALDAPYNTCENEKFFNRVMFRKVKSMLKVQKVQYGKTISGSSLFSYVIKRKRNREQSVLITPQISQLAIQISQKRSSVSLTPINNTYTSENRNKSIVILARLGGADTSGSFVIEGMIDYLIDSIEFESMKKVFDFYFIPMVNVDAVKYGNTLSNLTGSNLNNNWNNIHKQFQAEIYYLKQYLGEINRANPISLVANLKSEQQEVYSSIIGVHNDKDVEDCRIFPLVLSRRDKLFSYENSIFLKKNEDNSMCCILNQIYPKALIYQYNISHFEISKNVDCQELRIDQFQLKQANCDHYRLLGRDFLSNYLEHIKLYDKNVLLRDKWTKQITQISSKINKRQYIPTENDQIQQKFPQNFYLLPISSKNQVSKELPSILSIKSSSAIANLMNPKKIQQNKRIPRAVKTQKISNKQHPSTFKDFMMKRKEPELFSKTNENLTQNTHKQQQKSEQLQKPMSLFRIVEKKTSILKNLPSNTLNLQVDKVNKIQKSNDKKDILNFERQLLKRQLFTKLSRKVKIQDTLKIRKSKNQLKLGQILNNS